MKGCREMFKCVKAEPQYEFLKLFLHLIEQLFVMLLALQVHDTKLYIVFTVL